MSQSPPRPERSGELDQLRALWRLSLVLSEIARDVAQGDVEGAVLSHTELERRNPQVPSKIGE
jgi:hypothetical protein